MARGCVQESLAQRTRFGLGRPDGIQNDCRGPHVEQVQHRRTTTAAAGRELRPILLAPADAPALKSFARGFPLALLLLSFFIVGGTWLWLGAPVAPAPPLFGSGKLDCVSYAPFRNIQDPLTPGLIISEDQIAEDFRQLAGVTDCIRIYSTGNGLDKAPALAQAVGLKLLLGIWIGTQPLQNAEQIETAVALANQYPDVVSAIVVGSEVLLRREMTASALAGIVRSVKVRVSVPVTYADVWDVWLRSREVSDVVDFVTIHILPYWDDLPIRAERAGAHVDAIRQRAVAAFAGKEILVGKTGWPSTGRMREGALPSRTNQARVLSEILALSRQQNFRVNLIEAYDQPWKRQWEGTVGGHWGLFDADQRALKYPAGAVIRDYPFWKLQMGGGLAFCLLIFGVATLAARQGPRPWGRTCWLAVALVASVCGTLLGMTIERLLLQSLGIGGWVRGGALLAGAIGAPLLCVHALMSGRTLAPFLDLMGPGSHRRPSRSPLALEALLILTTLVACETALGLVFDPRYRDFPFAPLTMAALPYLILRVFNRSLKNGARPLAETVFAALLVMSAAYILFNEGYENWQSIWTSAAYVLLGIVLWQAKSSIPDVDGKPA